jgi:hypothetical protein
MSIERMLKLHPQAANDITENRIAVVRHAALCAQMCMSCADACLAEPMDMRECVRQCLDCADICAATSAIALRQTGAGNSLAPVMAACIAVCEQCAAQCERHDHDHCRLCAEMCRECAADCRKLAA